jgi:hypothetical protein
MQQFLLQELNPILRHFAAFQPIFGGLEVRKPFVVLQKKVKLFYKEITVCALVHRVNEKLVWSLA